MNFYMMDTQKLTSIKKWYIERQSCFNSEDNLRIAFWAKNNGKYFLCMITFASYNNSWDRQLLNYEETDRALERLDNVPTVT